MAAAFPPRALSWRLESRGQEEEGALPATLAAKSGPEPVEETLPPPPAPHAAAAVPGGGDEPAAVRRAVVVPRRPAGPN